MPTLPEPAGSAAPQEATAPITPAVAQPPTARAGLSAAVVKAVQGIPMFVDVKGLFLFADEELQARRIIATWATAEGLTIVAPDRTGEVFARALLGQHAGTGKACGAPLFPFQAAQRWRSELAAKGKLEVGVYCTPDCVMQVSVSIGTQGEGGTEFFGAPFDPNKPWQAELAARLPAIVDNGGHNRHGHLNNPVKLTGIPRARGADDRILDDTSGTLDPKEIAAARQCLALDRFAAVHLDYTTTGKVARCEPAPDHLAGATPCVCRALAAHTGKPGTRERFTVSLHERDPAPTLTKDKLKVFANASPAMVPDPGTGRFKAMTTDPAIELWDAPDRDQLSPCFADAIGVAKLAGRASLEFDSAGKATKATIISTTGTFTAAQQSCLRAAFLKVRAPCPSVPAAQATAEITVSFDPP